MQTPAASQRHRLCLPPAGIQVAINCLPGRLRSGPSFRTSCAGEPARALCASFQARSVNGRGPSLSRLRAVRADRPTEQLDAASLQLIADISRCDCPFSCSLQLCRTWPRASFAGACCWFALKRGMCGNVREVDEEHLSILEESARATQEASPPQFTGGLRQKVLSSINDLQRGLLERETEASTATMGLESKTSLKSCTRTRPV